MPSGSTVTRRCANSVTVTADVGTSTAISATASGPGVTSEGKTLMSHSVITEAHCRPPRNSAPPATSPSSEPNSASPEAIRRVVGTSAPTSRSAASRLLPALVAEPYGGADEDQHRRHQRHTRHDQ